MRKWWWRRNASGRRDRYSTVFCFALLALIWGTTWVAIKYSVAGIPPIAGATLRSIIAALVLGMFAKLKGMDLALPRGALKYIIGTAILLYVLNYGLVYWGEQYLNAGVTAIFFASSPLTIAIASNFLFKNHSFHFHKFLGILLGLCGIVVVFYDQLLITNFSRPVILASIGISIAAVAGAFNVLIVKRHLMAVAPITITIHQMLWGALGLGIVATLKGELTTLHYSRPAIAATLYLAVVGSAFTFVSYYKLLRKISAITISTISYLTPVVAVFTGWLLLDEPISLRAMMGAGAIFCSIAIIQMEYFFERGTVSPRPSRLKGRESGMKIRMDE